MGGKKAELERAGDYEDAIRVSRLAELASTTAQGRPHASRLTFEDARYESLDDIVEEFTAEIGGQDRTDGWQIKRYVDDMAKEVMNEILADLAKHEGLHAVVAVSDYVRVPTLGSIGHFRSFLETLKRPGLQVARLLETLPKTDRKWVRFAQETLGEVDEATAIALLQRVKVVVLGSDEQVKAQTLDVLAQAFCQPDNALAALREFLPTVRHPGVVITPDLVLSEALGNCELRSDLKTGAVVGIRELRPRIRRFAGTLIEEKAAVLMRDGEFVRVDRVVAIEEASRHRDSVRRVIERQHRNVMALRDVMTRSRLVVLTGDVGSGKTTETAALAEQLCTEPGAPLPVLVPCSIFRDAPPSTPRDLLAACSTFLMNSVAPDLPQVDLSEFLHQGTEVLLLLDGLDEAGRRGSGAIVTAAGHAVRTWPNLSVLSTARPLEALLPTRQWLIVQLEPLDRAVRHAFLVCLARGTEKDEARAIAKANRIEARLRANHHLALLGMTPLTCGMLLEVASTVEDSEPTLADLVHRLVYLRLEEWAVRSGRSVDTRAVTAVPDAGSRTRVLAVLSGEMGGGAIPRDRVLDIVEGCLPPGADTRHTAAIVTELLEDSGLLSSTWGKFHVPHAAVAQYLAGFLLARRVEAGERPSVTPEEWREAAFAVAELRRRATLNQHLDWVSSGVDALLMHSVVPAAAILVAESSSPHVASRWADGLERLGREPLWVFSTDRGESSSAIARSLHLTGERGFRWFYCEYLDPRYPSSHVGSAIVENIFLDWCLLQPAPISGETREQLETLRRVHEASNRGGRSLVNPLVFVLPELSNEFVIGRLIQYLGNPLTELVARGRLDSFIASDPVTISDACLIEAQRGHECAMAAAEIWLELNPVGFDTAIADAVLGARARPHVSSERWKLAVREVRRRLGEQRFERYLRYLLVIDDKVAIGASFALEELGETRLYVLGDAALYGLHGGVNSNGSFELATRLVDDCNHSALAWLVARFQERDRPIGGAHGGWWRLLIHLIIRAPTSDESIWAFNECIEAADGFVLPRDQIVRSGLRRLLEVGGTPYREALEGALSGIDVRRRHAAAMILVACTDDPPIDAWLEALRVFEGLAIDNPWEWEDFLLARSLTRRDLSFLRTHSHRLPRKGRAVALLLLRQHGNGLSADEEKRLVISMLTYDVSLHDSVDLKREIFSTTYAYDALRAEFDSGSPLAGASAAVLLTHHRHTLDLEARVRATVLAVRGNIMNLNVALREAGKDPEFAKDLRIHAQCGDLLQLLLGDCSSDEWMPVLASNFRFEQDDHHNMEPLGLLLLRGNLSPVAEKAIGMAASELYDAAVREGRAPGDGAIWLALLADEYASSRADEFGSLVAQNRVSYSSAIPAACARAAVRPSYCVESDRFGGRASPLGRRGWGAEEELVDGLDAIIRAISPDGPFHHNILSVVFDYVVGEPATGRAVLNRERANGYRWSFAQALLDWSNGVLPSSEVVVAGFPEVRFEHIQPRPSGALASVYRWWWRTTRDAAHLRADVRSEVLAETRARLAAGRGDQAMVGAMFLDLGGTVSASEVMGLVKAMITPGPYQADLVVQMARWLTTPMDDSLSSLVVRELNDALFWLDAEPKRYFTREPLLPLTLALGGWVLGTAEYAVCRRVFLRGLAMMPVTIPDGADYESHLGLVAPLLARMPAETLHDALAFGADTGEPSMRAICLIFLAALGRR